MKYFSIAVLIVLSLGTARSEAERPEIEARYTGEASAGSEVRALIDTAGNLDEDSERLAVLKQFAALPDVGVDLEEDVARLVKEIERWLGEHRLDYFGRTVSRDLDWDFGIDADSPVYPLTWIYRARMLIWYTMESGSVWRDETKRTRFLGKAKAFLNAYVERFPENRIARMYLGDPIPNAKTYSHAPGAPDWAIHQREGLERLADIVEWWIDNRTRESGEYGGGWGDDCEMWRWWTPVLIGFADPKIMAAQQRFSEAMMGQPHMRGGYTARMSDVEHTAEDSADVITPMMHLDPDNPVWLERAQRLAKLMETLWTGRNARGQLQFKSTYFTIDRLDEDPRRACDTVYHPRTVQPALLYWQRTGDANLAKLFSTWMDTWVDATARAENGKPAGIIPSAIHWPDGRVGGLAGDWWDPRNHSESTLYLWPSAMTMMMNCLLLSNHMTGEDKYLEPIRSMALARLGYLENPPEQDPPAGSEAWCASQMGFVSGVVAKYRFLTGRDEFDALLRRDRPAYTGFRMAGERSRLTQALKHNAAALRVNWPGYTSEVRYTDRVLRFPQLYGGGMMTDRPVEAIRVPDTNLLYSTVTGDPGDALYFPMNAVRWLTPPRDIAALVTDSGKTGFAAELYHFGEAPRKMRAELYLLAPGNYVCTITDLHTKKVFKKENLTVRGKMARIEFQIPARTPCKLAIY